MELLGSTIGGRYRLERLLSDGGTSTVFEGTDLLLNRMIAVKVLRRRLTADPAFLARFWQEAQAAAAVSHPGIVEIYDFGQHDGTNFIVLELVKGMPLNKLLAKDGPLQPARTVRITAGICDALEAAHRRGLIHRDIKPGNIMVRPGDSVKIMDFGLARAAEVSAGLTDPGMVVGTALYLSPEQVTGRRADARSDIYALGVCMYELLSGERPFPGTTPAEIATQHVKATPRPLDQLRPGLPAALVAAVHRAIAKRPEDRQPSAAALRASLEEAVGIPAWRPRHRPNDRPNDRASSEGLAPLPGPRVDRRHERADLVHGVAGGAAGSAQRAGRPRQARRRWLAAAALGLFVGAAGSGIVRSVWDAPVAPSIDAARPNQVQTPTTSPEREHGRPATPPQQDKGGRSGAPQATKPKRDDGGGTTQAPPDRSAPGESTSGGSTSGGSTSGGSTSGGSTSGGSTSGGSGGSGSDSSSGSLTDLVDPILGPLTDPLPGP